MAVKKISAGIALEGEKEFRTAITGINKELGVLKSEMAATKETFDGQANTLTALTTKHTSLSKILETQKQKVVEVNAGLENAKSNYEKAGNKVDELKKAHEDAVKAMKAMEDSSDSTTEEIREQEQEVARLVKELAKSEDTYEKASNKVKDWEKSLNIANKEVAKTDNALKKNAEYMREAGISADKCATSIDEFGKRSKNASAGVNQTENAIDAMGQAIAASGIDKGLKETIEALKECANASIEFESAITGVYKTVDGTDAQLQAISDGIKEMSTVIPTSTTELAAVAEAAGQLGIKTEDVLKFTEVMTNLGVTTNLTAEDAAQKIAKFANIVGTSAEDYERLGSVIVAMGNNFATTEADVTNMATNLASAGKLAGMSESNIVALSTAMSSVGIQAEAGGTAMTQTFTAIEKAVASGGDDLEKFAKISNMSSEQFANAWENEAITAVQAFIGGLGELDEKGESATLVLDEMGLSGIRQAGMIKSLALASDTLTDAITTADIAWQENTALTEEAGLRYGTLESKQQLLANSANLLKIAIGDQLTPALAEVVAGGADLLDWATDFIQENPWIVSAIMASVTALGLLLAAFTAFSAVKAITPAIAAFNAALAMNPAIAVAMALVGLAAAVTAFAITLPKASDEASVLARETKALADEVKELKSSIAEQEQAFESNMSSVQAQYGAYQTMTDRLYELDSALRNEMHTTSEANAIKSEMVSLANELNSAMPGLNLEIDEQNGLVKQGTEYTEAYIDSMQEKAKQAATEKQLTELYMKQAEAQAKLRKAELDREVAAAGYAAASEVAASYSGRMIGMTRAEYNELSNYSKALKEAETAIEEATDAEKLATDGIEDKVNALQELGNVEDESIMKKRELAIAEAEATKATAEATEAIETKYNELRESIESSVAGAISAFSEFSGGQEITAKEMQENLESQIEGLTAWKDNMLTLSQATGQGMTEELMTELTNMGPEGANAVQELVAALEKNDGSFEKLAKTWTDALNLKDPIATEMAAAVATAAGYEGEFNSTGYNLAAGLAAGINSGTHLVVSAAANMAAAADKASSGRLEINSPSKVFMRIGGGITEGLAKGMTDNTSMVTVAAEKLTKSTVDNMSKKLPKGVQKAIKKGFGVSKTTRDGVKKSAKELSNDIHSAAKSNLSNMQAMGNVSLKQQEAYWKAVAKKQKKGTEGYKKAKQEQKKVQAAILKQQMSDWEANLDHRKALDQVSLKQEVDFWTKYLKKAKKGSDDYKRAQAKLHAAKKDLAEQDRSNQVSAFEHAKALDQRTLKQEVDFWAKYLKTAKKGTEDYRNAERAHYAAQKELNQRRIDLQNEWTKREAEINENLKNSIKSVTDAYNESVKSRSSAIMSSMGLFDEFASTTEKTGDQLLENLASQVQGLYDWTDMLADLEKRGLKGTLLEELQGMGPDALAELQQLNTLTDKQLTEYVALWEEKSRVAKQQATKEKTGLLAETNAEIRRLTAEANAELRAAATEIQKEAKELGTTVSTNIVTITAEAVRASSTSLSSSGKDMMNSIIDGINARKGEYEKLLEEMAAKAKAAAGIITSSEHSNFGAGTINAVNYATPNYTTNTEQTINVGGITINAGSVDMDNINGIIEAVNQGLGAALG